MAIPIKNAQDRKQVFREGGKVDVRDIVKDVEAREADTRWYDYEIKTNPGEAERDFYKHQKKAHKRHSKANIEAKVKKALKGKKKKVLSSKSKYKKGGKVKKDAPHLKSDNPEVQKMLDEGRKRYVKKQNILDKYEKMRPKKGKGLAAPPKNKRRKKNKKWEGQA